MSDLEMYKNNLDLGRLSIQLQMLPDLIKTRNMNLPTSSQIKTVTSVQTICIILNEIESSKTTLSEVYKSTSLYQS